MKWNILHITPLLLALFLTGCGAGDVLDVISHEEEPLGADWRTYRGYSYGAINEEEGLSVLYFSADNGGLGFYLDSESQTPVLELDLSGCDNAEYMVANLSFTDKNDDGYNDLCLPLSEDQLGIWLWEPDWHSFSDQPLAPGGPWLTFAPWPEELVYWDSSENEGGAARYTWSLPGDAVVVVERYLPLEGGMEAVLESVAEEWELEPAAATIREDEELGGKLSCAAYALAYETHEETGGFLYEERYIRDADWDFRVRIAAPLEAEGEGGCGAAGELLQSLAFQHPVLAG